MTVSTSLGSVFFYNLIYWLHWAFVAVCPFSSCGARGPLFSRSAWLLSQALGVQARLWCVGLVAPRPVESSPARDEPVPPALGRQIPIH